MEININIENSIFPLLINTADPIIINIHRQNFIHSIFGILDNFAYYFLHMTAQKN